MFTSTVAAGVDYYMANVHAWFAGTLVSDGPAWTYQYFEDNDATSCCCFQQACRLHCRDWLAFGANSTQALTYVNEQGSSHWCSCRVSELQTFLDGYVCDANKNGTGYFWFELYDEEWRMRFMVVSRRTGVCLTRTRSSSRLPFRIAVTTRRDLQNELCMYLMDILNDQTFATLLVNISTAIYHMLVLLVSRILIPSQRPLPRLGVLYDGLGVPQLGKLCLAEPMERIVNRVALDVLQLGHKVPDVVSLRIALLRLAQRVKILKYGCGSVPVLALHCHPPLLLAKSWSIKLSEKCLSPSLQSCRRCLVRNMR